MPRVCTICSHPQRPAVDHALTTGTPYRNIAGRFGTSLRALSEHRHNHLPGLNRNADAYRNTIHQARDLDLTAPLPAASIVLWWGSPPYNLMDKLRGGNSTRTKVRHLYADGNGHGDGSLMPEADYQAWQLRVLDEWHRRPAADGVAFCSHKPRHKGGRMIHPRAWVERSRLVVIGEVIWARPGTAQCEPRRLYPSHTSAATPARRRRSWSGAASRWCRGP